MSTIIENLVTITNKIKSDNTKPYFPEERLPYCLICGMICLDSDPTGLTCGQKKCLAELLTFHLGHTKQLRDLFSKQISDDELRSGISFDDLLLKIEQKLEDLDAIKYSIAEQLGLDQGDTKLKMEDFSEIEDELISDPEGGILSILGLTKRIAENLGIDTKGTLRELLGNIESEIKTIKEKIKKLIE